MNHENIFLSHQIFIKWQKYKSSPCENASSVYFYRITHRRSDLIYRIVVTQTKWIFWRVTLLTFYQCRMAYPLRCDCVIFRHFLVSHLYFFYIFFSWLSFDLPTHAYKHTCLRDWADVKLTCLSYDDLSLVKQRIYTVRAIRNECHFIVCVFFLSGDCINWNIIHMISSVWKRGTRLFAKRKIYSMTAKGSWLNQKKKNQKDV